MNLSVKESKIGEDLTELWSGVCAPLFSAHAVYALATYLKLCINPL